MTLLNDWKDDYYDLWLNIRFEFLKNWKRKRLLISSTIAFVLAFLFYLVPELSGTEFPSDAKEFLASNMMYVSFVLVLNAIFFGSDAINGEHYTKTALLIYPLPQRRSMIVFGKFIVQLLTSWIVILVYYGIIALEVSIVYGIDALTEDMVKSLLFSFLYMSALLAIAFFLSGLLDNPAVSMTFTFFILLLLFPITSFLLDMVDLDTSWILTNYSNFITRMFRFPTEAFGPGGGAASDALDFYDGIGVCFAYLVGFFLGSWFLALRKEV